jgi:hypothetical protein
VSLAVRSDDVIRASLGWLRDDPHRVGLVCYAVRFTVHAVGLSRISDYCFFVWLLQELLSLASNTLDAITEPSFHSDHGALARLFEGQAQSWLDRQKDILR